MPMLALANLRSRIRRRKAPTLPTAPQRSLRVEIANRVHHVAVEGDQNLASGAGYFFSETGRLPPGRYAAKINIIFSDRADGERIRIVVRTRAPITELDSVEVSADPRNRALGDQIILSFALERAADVEVCGYAFANAQSTLLRFITVVDAEGRRIEADFDFGALAVPRIADLKTILIGTTGVCNASCTHCPTNKPDRSQLGHGNMPMALFNKIINELAAGDFPGEFIMALFGDALADPFLEQRLRFIREQLPKAVITIPTNCGLFDPAKHRFILQLADIIPVHVEAASRKVYDRFMHPLKMERVFPRITSLLELDREYGKVHITTPVHRGNLAEIGNLYHHFAPDTVRRPAFTRIGNRSWDKGPWSELSIAPVGGYCTPHTLAQDFVVDWDGAVLSCCSDFSKSNRLGDLKNQTIAEVLHSPEWGEMMAVFRTKRWSQRAACSNCRWDDNTTIQALVQPAVLEHAPQARDLPAQAFFAVAGTTRDPQGHTHVDEDVGDGIVIYGPYQILPPGRYRVTHAVEITKIADGGGVLTVDVNVNYTSCLARTEKNVTATGAHDLSIDIVIDDDLLRSLTYNDGWSSFEFRISKTGVAFVHKGAAIRPLP